MYHLQHGRTQNPLPDITPIIQGKKIRAFFQQVISVNNQCVCGLEGLVRGVSDDGLIAPKLLFEAAEAQGATQTLDRLCCECILSDYYTVYPRHRDKLLFVNIDASVIGNARLSGHFIRQASDAGIAPGNIVIEVNETRVHELKVLKTFIDAHREAGFLIALDDVGTGFSNLDRIPVTKPDIIKIDTSLVRNIQSDYHRQEVFRALIGLARQIGALVVAEGVETEEEALQALKLGAHMIQGFYFSRPKELNGADPFKNPRVAGIAQRFRIYMMQSINAEMERRRDLVDLIRGTADGIRGKQDYTKPLHEILKVNDAIECAYVLDGAGMQCCDAVFQEGIETARRSIAVCSFSTGTDHSAKNYYYHLVSEKQEHYITEPYVSPVTGSLCVTVSMPFRCRGGAFRILCMDIRTALRP